MKNIIKYQNVDIELDRLTKQKTTYEELKVIERMKNIVKNAQNNSIKLEGDAEALFKEYNTLKAGFDKQHKAIEKLTKKDIKEMTAEEVSEYLVQVNTISSELFMIERNLNIVINKVSKALQDFENNKKTALMARNKHKEAKDGYTKKVDVLDPKIASLQTELKSLEKTLQPEMFSKYKTYKNDGIFPVYVQLINDACGYCRMEIPKSKLDTLKNDNFIICEHCRRIIFK